MSFEVPVRSADPRGGVLELADEVWAEVRAEMASAYEKFPRLASGPHEAYAVLLEEVDELWDDVKANHKYGARAEAIQVAAMAIRFVVDLYSTRKERQT